MEPKAWRPGTVSERAPPGRTCSSGWSLFYLAIVFGSRVTAILGLIPLSILGVLLLLTGLELVLAFRDLVRLLDLFVAGVVIGLTFFVNLTAGFAAGLIVAWLFSFFSGIQSKREDKKT